MFAVISFFTLAVVAEQELIYDEEENEESPNFSPQVHTYSWLAFRCRDDQVKVLKNALQRLKGTLLVRTSRM